MSEWTLQVEDEPPVALDEDTVRALAILGARQDPSPKVADDGGLWLTISAPDSAHPAAVNAVARGIAAALKAAIEEHIR